MRSKPHSPPVLHKHNLHKLRRDTQCSVVFFVIELCVRAVLYRFTRTAANMGDDNQFEKGEKVAWSYMGKDVPGVVKVRSLTVRYLGQVCVACSSPRGRRDAGQH